MLKKVRSLRRKVKQQLRRPVFLSPRWRRRRVIRRLFGFVLLGLVALPSVHWANRLLYQHQLRLSEPFLAPLLLSQLGQRVVIVAPHPDDETLGCAGLIQHLLQRGIVPFIIVFTQGDGFDAAIHLKLREVRIKPEDRERFARLRRQETIAAMRRLGLPASHVLFLDFSERTLATDWLERGDERPLKALAQRLEQLQPTTLILPSRYDDHPIHAVVCSIGWATLFDLLARGRLAKMPLVLEVLIHYGEFPRPQGFLPALELAPPTDLLLTARWFSLPLSPTQQERKWQALQCYRTQRLPLTWRFLKSFVRANELFAAPFSLLMQPDREYEPRSVLGSLDITQISVSFPTSVFASSKPQVNITVRLRGKVSSRFRYGLQVWQPKGTSSSLPLRLNSDEKTVTASFLANPSLPLVVTAFTGYGRHILDVAPVILTEGISHGVP